MLEAFEQELGCRAGETSADGEVTLRTIECLGGCGWGDDRRGRPPLPPAASRPSDVAGDREGAPWLAAPLVVLADADEHDLTKLAAYGRSAATRALAKARAMAPAAVIDELIASELRGRGGAFFPTGRKWSFVPKLDQNPNPHYLVVNADESEPGSFKDHEILAARPAPLHRGLPDHRARDRVERASSSTSAASTSSRTRSSSRRSRS